MRVTPAEPAAGPETPATGEGLLRAHAARLRLALLAGGSALVLLAIALIAGELAALRVPQHRAALEKLIRHETGLDVRFRELTVRWGWYGPEAVFHSVVLGEPGGAGPLLSAPQLVVGLDAWRMVRSGQLEAGRITLIAPDADLGALAAAPPPAGARTFAVAPPGLLDSGARVLSRWRGGRIEVEGGTVRAAPAPGAAPLVFNIRHAQLRRLGARWSADAFVLLPPRLGASAHLSLTLDGDPARLEQASGTLGLDGRRLEFGAWRALAASLPLARYLPRSGGGNFELRARFEQGALQEAGGRVHADALQWDPPQAAGTALRLERLRGPWQLTRQDGAWHFSATPVELLRGGAARASVSVEADADGRYLRGRAQHLPLPALAALASWYAPQLPPGAAGLDGAASELSFDFDTRRPAATRLQAAARLEQLALAGTPLTVSGLSARLTAVGPHLVADLTGHRASVTLAREQPVTLSDLDLTARVALQYGAGGWRLSAQDLQVRRADLSLAASGTLAASGAAAPRLSAHVVVRDTDALLATQVLGPQLLAALGPAAAQLTAGRIDSADFELRTPLAPGARWDDPGNSFSGALSLRDARLAAGDSWPGAEDLAARIDWRGARLRATFAGGRSGSFRLSAGRAEWDGRGTRATHLSARLAGRAQEALDWLRAHPQLGAWTPAVQDLEVQGDTLLDLDLTLPTATPVRAEPMVRASASFDGARLRLLAGVPPLESVRGTLVFAGGHLQRSNLGGQWLGGPVSLVVTEHGEHGAPALAISGRGTVGAHPALLAAGAGAAPLAGSAEWSALLTVGPGSGGATAWQLRADSSLVGVASRLPEPLAKTAAAALPLHLELQGAGDAGELQVSCSERLRALVALTRGPDGWRIERGAVRLDATAPILPAAPVLALDGRVGRLDLPAYLALWHEAARDAALPALAARLSAAQLVAGTRVFPEVTVTADALRGAGEVQLASADLSGSLRWPAQVSEAHPAAARFADFNLTEPRDAALAAALAQLFAPALQLDVDDLAWQGRSLGRLTARLAGHGGTLEVSGLQLAGPLGETRASGRCAGGACSAQLTLDSHDVAATLAALGLRSEISAARGLLSARLQWSPGGPSALASLGGDLHMQLEEGAARVATAADPGTPLALLPVPALMAALSAQLPAGSEPGLQFARVTAGFALDGGEATTSDLHFDGDAEIMMRGRVGLVARDYDAEAVILRGEERLPAALRRLVATPRVAAAWLSLRELFGGAPAERGPAVLRLRGTWSDPIVTAAE